MSYRVAHHLTIYRETGWYAAHPTVVRAANGDLLVHFHRSPDVGNSHHAHPLFDVRACRSQDEGQSWSKSTLVTTDPLGGVLDFGTHTLPDGSLYLHASTVELVPQSQDRHCTTWTSQPGIPFWIRSHDHGVTWTEPRRFSPYPDGVWGAPAEHSGVCRSGLLVLPDGQFLLPGKATAQSNGGQPYFGMCWESTDGGENWSYGGRLAEDPIAHFSEPTIYQTPSGRILVLYRCHPRQPGRDNCLALVTSDDDGFSWSQWRYTTIRGCPGHLLGLRDGCILMTVGTRWASQQGCMARVLDPEGTDLDTAQDLVIRADSVDVDCGYPWAVELNDGRVLAVYYYGYPDGSHGIEGTILERT
ncbi:glycoside hydrolase [Chloroflexi bacterium TSY]|nr:glycoside hydrolase [Chloroflexi bacterium TSY]